eukprot:Lankesteria_metandrocarpae@DN5460_c1_g1_i3.p1
MNSAMMIYIFFLVVPLLVMVPTLAMKINGDDVIAETVTAESGRRSRKASSAAESPTLAMKINGDAVIADTVTAEGRRSRKASGAAESPTLAMEVDGDDVIADTVTAESGRRSRRASSAAESPTDTQKVDAFLKLMNANETTKAIADNPEVDTSNRMNNVVNTYASNAANSESVLKEYIKDKITDEIIGNLYLLHTSNGRYPDSFWQRMQRYVVTVYNNTSGYRFKVHEYNDYAQNGVVGAFVDVKEMAAAVFSKSKTIVFPSTPTKGVFVFLNSPKVARKCVLERSLVSNDRSVQLYIFHWERSSFNTYDAENVEKYGAGVHASVMVLSDGVDRPDV